MTLEERATALSRAESVAVLEENAALKRQNDWCKRHLFGQKSARRLLPADPQQLPLAGLLPSHPESSDLPPPPVTLGGAEEISPVKVH